MEIAIFLFFNPIIVLVHSPVSLIICLCLHVSNTKEHWSQGTKRFKKILNIKQKDKNLAMKLNEQMWKWEYLYRWNTSGILQIKCTCVYKVVKCTMHHNLTLDMCEHCESLSLYYQKMFTSFMPL